MNRCWEVSPTSERLVEDMVALPRILKVLIEHQGIVVPHEPLGMASP